MNNSVDTTINWTGYFRLLHIAANETGLSLQRKLLYTVSSIPSNIFNKAGYYMLLSVEVNDESSELEDLLFVDKAEQSFRDQIGKHDGHEEVFGQIALGWRNKYLYVALGVIEETNQEIINENDFEKIKRCLISTNNPHCIPTGAELNNFTTKYTVTHTGSYKPLKEKSVCGM